MWCWCVESCLDMKFYIQEFKFNIKKIIFQVKLWHFLDWHILGVGIVTVKKVVQWTLTKSDAIVIISWPYYNWAAWVSKSLKFVPSNCLIDTFIIIQADLIVWDDVPLIFLAHMWFFLSQNRLIYLYKPYPKIYD